MFLVVNEPEFEIGGFWETFDVERVDTSLRLVTVGVSDVEFVIDKGCWVRFEIDGELVLAFVNKLPLFLDDDDGIGMTVEGWTSFFAVVVADSSFVEEGISGAEEESVDGNCLCLTWDFETFSFPSSFNERESKYNCWHNSKMNRILYYLTLFGVPFRSLMN